MGLMIHSLEEIPESIDRDYFIYLLDYGWQEPLSDIIMENFSKISDQASKSNSVFIKGTVGSHVDNEVLSWHHINGESGEDILPALLITTQNPHVFRNAQLSGIEDYPSKIVLIPIIECCSSSADVLLLIKRIFSDINEKKSIENFSIVKEMKKGIGNNIVDGVILQPNFFGIGFDLKKFFQR